MSTKLFDLNGKIAMVTGASRGIGEAIASLLAEQGAHLIVSSRKRDDCQVVVDRLRAAGLSAEALACHVGNM
ncbi:MAG TPA: SDR family NAD(P)-dependent oxidoreductase, partial [Azonexus sp.]|nr:SDR family NAD(P)-dependent oxidoreductase [Azonexus sp.]